MLAGLIVFAPNHLTWAQEESASQNQEIAFKKLRYFGKKYSLWATETPNIYKDRDGDLWTAIPRSNQGYTYIPLKDLSDNQKKLAFDSKSSDQKLYVDSRGQEWIQLENKKWVEIEKVSTDEIVGLVQKFSYKNIPGESLRALTPENIKFSAATLIVEMATCFGPGMSDFAILASSETPTCVSDFAEHLLDWKGWVSFYGFMVTHRGAQTAIMQNILQMTAAHRGIRDPKVIQQLAQKIMPMSSYLGMALGSLTSSVISHVLSAPDWANCFKNMNKQEEGVTSQFCKDAVAHILNIDGFWDDFFASSSSMIMAGIASAKTQELLVKSPAFFKKLLAAKNINGIRVLGGSAAAAEGLAQEGLSAARILKVAPMLLGATPGWVVVVVTQVGSYTLFVAWDHFLKTPVAKGYHDFFKSISIKSATVGLLDAVEKSKVQQKWETPYLVDKCFPRSGEPLNIDYPNFVSPAPEEMACEKTFPLVEQLAVLNKTATVFRQKVALANFEEATQKWYGKTKGYLDHYRAYKAIVEFVYYSRELINRKFVNVDTSLNKEGLYGRLVEIWADLLEEDNVQLSDNIKNKIREQLKISAKNTGKNEILKRLTEQELSVLTQNITKSKTFQDAIVSYKALQDKKDQTRVEQFNSENPLLAQVVEQNHNMEKLEKLMLAQRLKKIFETKSVGDYSRLMTEIDKKNNKLFDGVDKLSGSQIIIAVVKENLFLEEYKNLRKKLIDIFQSEPTPSSFCQVMDSLCFARRWTVHFDGSSYSQTSPFAISYRSAGSEFLRGLTTNYGEEVVSETFYNILCGGPKSFESSVDAWWGAAKASFTGPFLIQNIDREQFTNMNCRTYGKDERPGDPEFSRRSFSRVWVLNGKMFSDPLSLLIDGNTQLVSGSTSVEMENWWNKNAFLAMTQLLQKSTIGYQKILEEKLFTQIPKMSAQELIHSTSPIMRGKDLEWHIGSPAAGMTGETPLLAESWMGQIHLIIEIAKFSTPLKQKDWALLEQIKLAFADYILGINSPIDITSLKSKWDDAFKDFQVNFKERDVFMASLKRHNAGLKEAALGKDKVRFILKSREILLQKIDLLYQALSGQDYKNLGAETTDWKTPLSQEKIQALSGDNYKKYIFYILFHDSLSKLLSEIDDTYDKLGMKPLIGFGKETK